MKTTFIYSLTCLFPFVACSQIAQEWLDQKNTQLKYLAQQIAANKVYIEYLQKGYKIAKEGLATIGSIKDGHLNLDTDFFRSLKEVNPRIFNDPSLVAVYGSYHRLHQTITGSLKLIQHNDMLTADESSLLKKSLSSLTERIILSKLELEQLLTSNELEMTDDARLERIDRVKANVSELQQHATQIMSEVEKLVLQRKRERREVKELASILEH
jgi:hypothetical protein